METLLDVTKGLHQDFKPIDAPAGTYRNLVNGNRQLNGTVTNERGTVRLATTAKRIVGSYVLDKDVILVLYPSEIGVLNSQDQYSVITNNIVLNIKQADDPTGLDYIPDYVVDITGRKNFKGERIIYLADGVNPDRAINLDDTSILTSSNFGDLTQIQLNPSLPNIAVNSVNDQGSLPTGVYQFAARLLTRSTNSTPFSNLTPLVPIIDEDNSQPFNSQDGAPPQTLSTKSISLTVTSIDTSYSFIEIAVTTYIGTANVATSNIVARLPIDGNNTVNFTYSTTAQNKESVSLEELSVKPINYTSSKSIEQKDNILIRSNLKAEDDSFDFQFIVNNAKLKYYIEEIPWQMGYKDAITAALKKSYRRGEAYSFALVPNYKSKSNSTAYHIPGIYQSSSSSIKYPANTSTKELGTYYSTETYPSGRGFPTNTSGVGPNGNRIRHHIMPSVQQEPIFVNIAGQLYIRLLGVELDMTDVYPLLSTTLANKLTGFSLVRQERGEKDQSILAQGIAQTHYKVSSSSETALPNVAILQPFGNTLYGNTAFLNASQPSPEIGFFSPETVIYQSSILGTNLKLETVAALTGTQNVIYEKRTFDTTEGKEAAFMFFDYNNRTSETLPAAININSGTVQYIQPSQTLREARSSSSSVGIITPVNTSISLLNSGNVGYLFFTPTSGVLPVKQNSYSGSGASNIPEFFFFRRPQATDHIYLNGNIDATSGTSEKYLHNITRDLSSQYGTIFDANYILLNTIPLTNPILRVFGGDTFISRFAYESSSDFAHLSIIAPLAPEPFPIEFRALTYFFVESSINTNYRHYINKIGKEGDAGYVVGTVPYYPKVDAQQIFNISTVLGQSRGYNKQYSFESNIIKYFPKQLAEETVTSFENRSIYSEQAVEGEQVDSFRVFLPNNYHDIPKNRGSIINTFIHNNTFCIHTTGTIYKTAFNERAVLTSSIGEAVLGNGGVFSRPSEPVLTIDGGYGGIQTKHGLSTPFGYFFFDGTQKKFFQYTDQLIDIAEQGMKRFFASQEDNLKINLAFDYEYNRLLIGNFRAFPIVTGWTLSYHTLLKSWSSYHSYIPHHMFSRGKDLYLATTTAIYKHNIGPYGSYLGNNLSGNTVATEIDLVFNDVPDKTKIFDNLVLYTTSVLSTSVDGIDRQDDTAKQLYKTFTTFQGFNETKNTGEVSLIVPQTFDDEFSVLAMNECFAKLKNDEFRIAIPCDLVINSQGVILDPTNLYPDRAYKPRMSGKWMIARLKYDNSLIPNSKLSLHSAKKIFRNKTNGRENIR